MAKNQAMLVKSKDMHQMVLVERKVDALTGEDWDILECPICGYLCKKQWEPYRNVDLRLGEGMLTEADAEHITQLCKEGPVGRAHAQAILAASPAHGYVRVPTEAELREMARGMGKEAEFDATVEKAIIEGKPLFTFGMGDVSASTWPARTGPRLEQ